MQLFTVVTMIFKSKKSFSWVQSVGYAVCAKAAGLLKATYIFGSTAAFFSATNVITPLAGAFGGVSGSCKVFVISLTLRVLMGGFIGFHSLAYHIPGLFAALAWSTRSKWLHIGVPVACMALFIAHPVGLMAIPYSFYWIIPMVLSGARPTLFTQALGATFIAHAVGSVIWIYTVPMTAAAWYALLPLVLWERIAFAVGQVAVYQLVTSLRIIDWQQVAFSLRRFVGLAQ